MRKVGIFFALALAAIGCIGGVCYLWHCSEYVMSIGVAVLSYAAWPRIKDWFKVVGG